MKNKRKLKVAAGLLAALLIMAILFLTNAFVGNPLSAYLAKNAAKNHIDKNYKTLNLKLEKPFYNFKDGNYIVEAFSETSIDTHFSIYYAMGKTRDDYDYTVGDKFNTFMRLEKEYTKLVKEIIEKDLGYKDDNSFVTYEKNELEEMGTYLELDMEFNRKLPLEPSLRLSLQVENPSLDKIVKILEEAHQKFLEEDCVFEEYSASIEDKDKAYSSYGIKSQDIEGKNLMKLLMKAIENQDGEYEGIGISIREKDKD